MITHLFRSNIWILSKVFHWRLPGQNLNIERKSEKERKKFTQINNEIEMFFFLDRNRTAQSNC